MSYVLRNSISRPVASIQQIVAVSVATHQKDMVVSLYCQTFGRIGGRWTTIGVYFAADKMPRWSLGSADMDVDLILRHLL